MNQTDESIWTRRYYIPGLPRLRPRRWFTLRMLRRYLFCAACLATLTALFYAEEDWRGKRAWESYKSQSQARGTDLDFRAYFPPPVPDDQNFAMTPMFRPMFEYESTSNGVRWRETNWVKRGGMFSLDLSGSAPRPELGSWAQGRPLDLKEWQVYFRGTNFPPGGAPLDLIKKYGGRKTIQWPTAPAPQEPAADILLALTYYSPQLEELRQASARPSSRFPLHYQDLEETILPHLAPLVQATRLLQLRSTSELVLEKNQEAVADVRLAFYCAEAIRTEPIMVSQFMRNRILMESLQPVWEGLRTHQWSEQNLKEMQQSLSNIDLLSDYNRVLKAECALAAANIESAADNRGFFWTEGETTYGPPEMLHCLPRGWFYQNEVSAARFYQEKLLVDVLPGTQRAFPSLSLTNSTLLAALPATPYTFLFKLTGRVISPQTSLQAQTAINLARVACGLERCRMARGRYPESLEALVPEFLDKLPRDIINGQPLHYRLGDNGQFVLYSVGWNEKDDGGAFPKSLKPSADRWPDFFTYGQEAGDWVWRYPKNN